jgi:Ribbon-helix-helix protein, copG family
MTISARLSNKTVAELDRFCKANKITKTEAIERGIAALLEQSREQAHPAFAVFQQLKLVPEAARPPARRSSDAMRDAIRAKYSR